VRNVVDRRRSPKQIVADACARETLVNERLAARVNARSKEIEQHLHADLDHVFDTVFETTPQPFIVTNVCGQILGVNAAASRFLGVEARFLKKKPLAVYTLPGHASDIHAALAEVISRSGSGSGSGSGSEYDCELTLCPRDGQERAVRVRTLLKSFMTTAYERRIAWMLDPPLPPKQEQQQQEQQREELIITDTRLRDTSARFRDEQARCEQLERDSEEKDRLIGVLLSGLRRPFEVMLEQVRALKETCGIAEELATLDRIEAQCINSLTKADSDYPPPPPTTPLRSPRK
jgi:PAS domain S-box-containing protein